MALAFLSTAFGRERDRADACAQPAHAVRHGRHPAAQGGLHRQLHQSAVAQCPVTVGTAPSSVQQIPGMTCIAICQAALLAAALSISAAKGNAREAIAAPRCSRAPRCLRALKRGHQGAGAETLAATLKRYRLTPRQVPAAAACRCKRVQNWSKIHLLEELKGKRSRAPQPYAHASILVYRCRLSSPAKNTCTMDMVWGSRSVRLLRLDGPHHLLLGRSKTKPQNRVRLQLRRDLSV